MNTRKPNKVRNSIRQRFSTRMVLVTGISIAAIAAGIFVYIELSNSTTIKAKNLENLSPDNLPADMVVNQLVLKSADTNQYNGNRYKVAKPLSLTPVISQ